MSKYKEYAVVCSQEQIAADIYSLWIQTEEIARAAGPGQFLSVYTGDGTKLLPRPISICEIDREQGRLRLVYRVTGPGTGTAQFSRLKPGDQVEVMGPLGNGFPKDLTGTLFLVGGGIGIPPMLELAKELPGDKKIILGFRDEQYLTEELNAYGDVYVATEDGSAGTKGNVLDAIRENGLHGDVICACGPTPMLRALKEYSMAENIPCYLSLEERMACGIGACLGCVCQSTEVDGHSNVRNKRVCKDGPVFLATEVEL